MREDVRLPDREGAGGSGRAAGERTGRAVRQAEQAINQPASKPNKCMQAAFTSRALAFPPSFRFQYVWLVRLIGVGPSVVAEYSILRLVGVGSEYVTRASTVPG